MAEDDTPQEFLRRMDAGEFDGTLSSELRKLSKEKLSEVANALMDRDSEREKKRLYRDSA